MAKTKTFWLPKMGATQFMSFCIRQSACSSGLQAIRGKTLARWWKETKHGEWMLWLCLAAFPQTEYNQLASSLRKATGDSSIAFGTVEEHIKQAAWLRKHVKVRP
jgi:hypothetical protein